MEARRLTVLLLLDFSKAFDIINSKLLCSKLSNLFGFSSKFQVIYVNKLYEYAIIKNHLIQSQNLLVYFKAQF